MARWRTWLAALAVSLGFQSARVQAQGFTPPAPTPAPWTAPMPTPGSPGPVPFGPSMLGPGDGIMGGPGAGGVMPAGGDVGPGGMPPPSALQLTNYANAWDDDTPADSCWWCRYSSISVDLLILHSEFSSNPAFSTNLPRTARAARAFGFTHDNPTVVPRINLDLKFGDYWGVRGSWMRWETAGDPLQITNGSPNGVVFSPPTIDGNFLVRQVDRLVINNVAVRPDIVNQFRTPGTAQVVSPRPFFFINQVPRQTLLNNIFGQAQQPLPPFTLLNAVQAGFPDTLSFQHRFEIERADLELTRSIELGTMTGLVGLGAMYGQVSHAYRATRVNSGGTTVIPGYDPFVLLPPPLPRIFDANIRVNEDSEQLIYQHTFGGTGPKFSFELGKEITSFARLYSKWNGAILFGNRKETATYQARQQVQIFDTERNPPADIFYTQTIDPQTTVRNSFTVMPVGEVEAGIEIAFGGRLFPVFKCGAFGQAWLGGGNATNPNANLLIYGINASLGLGF